MSRRQAPPADGTNDLLVGRLALFSIVCMLVGASGGISFLVSAAGLREIRAWNRISIVIAWFTVVFVAMAIDWGGPRLQHRWASRPSRARFAPTALAVLVVVIAFADQGGRDAPPYQAVHAKYASDSAFFAAVHDRLGDGAAVFNLPYQPFPEAPPRVEMGEFDEVVGYLYQPTLKWSFGSMRGRHPDYPKALENQPPTQWMTAIAVVGFTGIVVDRAGYTEADRALESQIADLAGPPLASTDARYSFYDLRAFAIGVRTTLGDAGVEALAAETLALQSTPPNP